MNSWVSGQRHRVHRSAGRAVCLVVFSLLLAGPALAERAWVRGEVRLNVRTGPGVGYRIVGQVVTGDALDLLERGDNWTRVRLGDGIEGWIPGGYLRGTPPPSVRVGQLEEESGQLRDGLQTANREVAELSQARDALAIEVERQQTELTRLEVENRGLKAGARWPYLITGASILTFGMLVGWSVARSSARRSARRIKL